MTRRFCQLALAATLVATPLLAQHGGGMGGPGGPGGGMGGPGGGFGRHGGGGDFDRRDNGAATHAGPLLGPPGRWWDDHHVAKTLNLRPDQQHRMDGIFEANKTQLLNDFVAYERAQLQLNGLAPQDLQDETKVFAGIDRVEQARAALEKENAHILLAIRHELDPSQLTKLDSKVDGR